MRPIHLIVIHCSASDLTEQDSLEAVKHLHTANKKTKIKWGEYETTGNGWSDVGYHYVITKDGNCHAGRPLHKKGAHVKGHNANSIGVCLTGDKDFTEAQFETLREVVDELIKEFGLTLIDVVGHGELDKKKTCPNFDVAEKLMLQRSFDEIISSLNTSNKSCNSSHHSKNS